MIEIGKKSENYMSYSDAVLYCFALGEGWRLPNCSELYRVCTVDKAHNTWYSDDPLKDDVHEKWLVIPVREKKDD